MTLIGADQSDINAGGGDIVITKPTAVASGETLIAFLTNGEDVGSGSQPAEITGFTTLQTDSANSGRILARLTSRVADGTEGASFTSTVGANTFYSVGVMVRVTQGPTTSPIDASGTASGSGTTVTLPSVTTLTSNCLAIAFVTASDFTNGDLLPTAPPSGWARYKSYDGNNTAVFYKPMPDAGSTTGSSTLTLDFSSTAWVAQVVTVKVGSIKVALVDQANGAVTASRSPALTFTTNAIAAGDVVVMWPSSTGTTVAITTPSGWENPLGGNTDVESDSHEICCVAHRVTAAEAGSTTFTATNLFDATQTGNVVGCVVRSVHGQDIFSGAASTFDSSNTVTPHVLAGVTPDESSGLVLSAVAKDATGAYGTIPSGWSELTTSNTNQGKWLGAYNTVPTSGSAISNTNITPSAGDEYASITVVMRPAIRFDRVLVLPSTAVHRAANW